MAVDGKLIVFEIELSTNAWIAACMRTCSSAVMSDETTNTRRIASGTSGTSWQPPVTLTVSLIRSRASSIQPGPLQRLLEQRAGVGQQQIAIAVLHRAGVGQGEDRLAAVAFAARHGADGAGGRDGRLGRVADAVAPDAGDDLIPVEGGAAPVVRIRRERRGGVHLRSSGS